MSPHKSYIEKPVFEFLLMLDPICVESFTKERVDELMNPNFFCSKAVISAEKNGERMECFMFTRCNGNWPKYYMTTCGNTKEEIKNFLGTS